MSTIEDWIQLGSIDDRPRGMGELGKSKRQKRRDRNNALARSQGYANMDQMMRAQASARAAAAASPAPTPAPDQQSSEALPGPPVDVIAPTVTAPASPQDVPKVVTMAPAVNPPSMPIPSGSGIPYSPPAYSGGSSPMPVPEEDVNVPHNVVEYSDQNSPAPYQNAPEDQSSQDAQAAQDAFVESQTSSEINQTGVPVSKEEKTPGGVGYLIESRPGYLQRTIIPKYSMANLIDRATNPHRFRRRLRKGAFSRAGTGIRRRGMHGTGLGQSFANSDEAKTKAAQLVKIADTTLESLWEKASVQEYSSVDNSPVITDDQASYVKISGAWIPEAHTALAAIDPNDTDPVIDQLSSAASVVIERRQEMMDRGVGMASPMSAAAKAFAMSVINDINAGVSKVISVTKNLTDPSKQVIPSWVKWGVGIYLGLRFLEAVKRK